MPSHMPLHIARLHPTYNPLAPMGVEREGAWPGIVFDLPEKHEPARGVGKKKNKNERKKMNSLLAANRTPILVTMPGTSWLAAASKIGHKNRQRWGGAGGTSTSRRLTMALLACCSLVRRVFRRLHSAVGAFSACGRAGQRDGGAGGGSAGFTSSHSAGIVVVVIVVVCIFILCNIFRRDTSSSSFSSSSSSGCVCLCV